MIAAFSSAIFIDKKKRFIFWHESEDHLQSDSSIVSAAAATLVVL